MEFTENDVKKVAHLARIELTPGETKKFAAQLSQIIGYIEKLNKVNTDGIEPISQTLDIPTPLRKDELRTQNFSAELMLSNAPEQVFDNFKVPQVIATKGGDTAGAISGDES